MKITLCVEENKIECKGSGNDIKVIYQIPHFGLRKQRKNKKNHLSRETKSNLKWMENYVQEWEGAAHCVFNLCFILDPTKHSTNVLLSFSVLVSFLSPRLYFTFWHRIHFSSFNLHFVASFSWTPGDPKLLFSFLYYFIFSSPKSKSHDKHKI